MTDRFISPMPLPTPRERELLTILAEECAEVIQRASKLIRFGRDEMQRDQPLTNRERLSEEIGHVLVLIDMCGEQGLLSEAMVKVGIAEKPDKVRRYLQSPEDEVMP